MELWILSSLLSRKLEQGQSHLEYIEYLADILIMVSEDSFRTDVLKVLDFQ